MQIVMELAGYTMGRSDLVRRAMSKKKADVMAKERKNFVYGNEAEGVPGCISKGIPEEIANKVFDEMTDFAKYAFNKSHAAAYAVVAYQTAYLKCHYPVEFMAALISSVKENSTKVTNYIQTCRTMGIRILPPDINRGSGDFSVSGGDIRYGLSAVKSVGDAVTSIIREEVLANGPFTGLEDFANRLSNKEANKRTVESFIGAGAFDSFGYNRRQMMIAYPAVLEQVAKNKKNEMSGQMSLLDFLGEEEKSDFQVKYPNVEEFSKEELLAKEKEMLGIYVSGHPLDDYMDIMEERTTARSTDFMMEEEDELSLDEPRRIHDKVPYTIGGMIADITVKTTRNGDNMAFLTIEDLYGTVEVVCFPRDYSRYKDKMIKDEKVLIKGNASISETEGKLLLSELYTFAEVRQDIDAEKKELWVRFPDMKTYGEQEVDFLRILSEHKGRTEVYVMIPPSEEEAEQGRTAKVKRLPDRQRIFLNEALLNRLIAKYGQDNVIAREKKA